MSTIDYEKAIADINRSLDSSIETIFLTCLSKHTSVASNLVRDVIRNGGDVSQFVPGVARKSIKKTKIDYRQQAIQHSSIVNSPVRECRKKG